VRIHDGPLSSGLPKSSWKSNVSSNSLLGREFAALCAAAVLLLTTVDTVAGPPGEADAVQTGSETAITAVVPDFQLRCRKQACAVEQRERISMPHFRPLREIAPASPLLDALVQNTPGYSDGYPAGVPETYAWCGGSYKPAVNRAPPPEFTAVTGWGQVYRPIGAAEYAGPNPSIEIANARTYVHLKDREDWVVVQDQARSPLAGAHFVADFSNNAAIPMEIRRNAGVVTTIGAPPSGYNSHFWIFSRGAYQAASVDGVYVQIDMRAVDGNLKVIANVGADWWRDASAPFEDGFVNNPGAGMSNWRVLSTNWSTLRFYSTSDDELLAAPPPPLQHLKSTKLQATIRRRIVAQTPCRASAE
jgi:hypothetical protein